ncbi:shikimate kinase [Phormidesmis priestleyi]|nr:shikimate kinase [Phormidesmis priestleyi]
MLKGVNLYLIGMMGAGKTTIGRLLAQHLSYRFFDTDAVIEQAATQTITQIFAESGEAAFRQLETQVLAQLSPYTQLVIATGGGIVLKRENWSYLRHGVVVWLDVPIEQLHQRLQQDTSRPILQDQKANLKEKLQALSDQRQSLYAQADLRITVMPDESATQVAARVMDAIAQKCQEKSQINERLRLMNQETPYQIEP